MRRWHGVAGGRDGRVGECGGDGRQGGHGRRRRELQLRLLRHEPCRWRRQRGGRASAECVVLVLEVRDALGAVEDLLRLLRVQLLEGGHVGAVGLEARGPQHLGWARKSVYTSRFVRVIRAQGPC